MQTLLGHPEALPSLKQLAYAKEEDLPYSDEALIEIRLVDEDGKPVPNQKYLLVLPDSSNLEGTLDANGWARHDEIDPGTCKVCFPEIDGRVWHPA